MMIVIITLIAYAVFTSCALYLASGHVLVRSAIVIGLFSCALLAWVSLDSIRGWSTTEVPERGFIVSMIVREPEDNQPGAIYVWVTADGVVRSHVLPYTVEDAKKAFNANHALGRGGLVSLKPGNASGGEGSLNYDVLEATQKKK